MANNSRWVSIGIIQDLATTPENYVFVTDVCGTGWSGCFYYFQINSGSICNRKRHNFKWVRTGIDAVITKDFLTGIIGQVNIEVIICTFGYPGFIYGIKEIIPLQDNHICACPTELYSLQRVILRRNHPGNRDSSSISQSSREFSFICFISKISC